MSVNLTAPSPAPTQGEIDDVRVVKITPLCSPAVLIEDLPASAQVLRKRASEPSRSGRDYQGRERQDFGRGGPVLNPRPGCMLGFCQTPASTKLEASG
ncbi:hypothetical protein BASA82_000675 [Batrachochytrium salamandrivorans]|nr:hypothetical protein BASA82_000675 [Batrachochytrium salamandrivorans]